MARKKEPKRNIEPDFVYDNVKLAKFINYVMRGGKKTIARKIVYGALEEIKEKIKKDPLEVFETAIKNASPDIEIQSKRVGGATYQVPVDVREERKQALAMRWILNAARSGKGMPMSQKLARELIEASENKGTAIRKKEDTRKMAEANRAFARMR
ncbi:MAG: 30S ribosomal protein S7 [Patescibacteria group bacterium]